MSTEREQKYARAVWLELAGRVTDSTARALTRSVMVVADAEQADLRAELKRVWANWDADIDAQNHQRAMRESAEAEVARLTRLLEQRTAALTRTIDAKNAAEARSMRAEALADRWQSATTWDGQPAQVDRAFGEALRTELDGGKP